jgi:glycosyltransferase involved in cell wall biosynthesis
MKSLSAHNRFPTQPWKTPLNHRLAKLQADLDAGFKIQVILYEQPDSSTFRYRVYNIAQALESSSNWRAAFFFTGELDAIRDLVLRCQLVTVARFRWTFELENLLTRVRLNRIPVAFDCDDLVFDPKDVPALINVQNIDLRTDYEMNYWFSYVARMNLTARMADAFITTNDYLGQALQRSFGQPAHIVRNFMNREQIDFSEQCRQEKLSARDQGPFTIGYFSGSPSHYYDLHSIADELCDLLETFSDLRILVVGYMDFAPRLKAYVDQGRIQFHKFVDYLTLQRLIAEVDINIAPLYPNDFTESKSELKFFEAALVDTITCASPTYAFRQAIKNGENGFLCRQGEWFPTISSIYKDRDLLAPLISEARSTALNQYSAAANLLSIEKACEALVDMLK